MQGTICKIADDFTFFAGGKLATHNPSSTGRNNGRCGITHGKNGENGDQVVATLHDVAGDVSNESKKHTDFFPDTELTKGTDVSSDTER